jgi:hypothetical protein
MPQLFLVVAFSYYLYYVINQIIMIYPETTTTWCESFGTALTTALSGFEDVTPFEVRPEEVTASIMRLGKVARPVKSEASGYSYIHLFRKGSSSKSKHKIKLNVDRSTEGLFRITAALK